MKSFSILALASGAFAAVQTVEVGQSGDTFSPNSLTAADGDIIQFNFHGSHSVTQSDFSSPCSSSGSSMINSGTLSSGSFSVEVNGTDPIWIFCAYARHCQSGMTMVINPPSSGDTLDSYTSAAQGTSRSSAPSGVQNGIVGDASSFGSSSSSSSSSASGSSASSAASSASSALSSASSALSSATSAASATTGSGASSTTSSGSSATSSGAADKVKAVGVLGAAGLFAALLA